MKMETCEPKTKTEVKKKVKRPAHRPRTTWAPIQKDLCHLIANSNMGWRSCLKELKRVHKNVPSHTTVENWLHEDKEFLARYARAKEDQADYLVEEMLQIADDSSEDEIFIEAEDGSGQTAKRVCNKEFIARSRLRVDTRKFIAAKLKPKKYGDKVDVTSGGEPLPGPAIVLSPMEKAVRLAFIMKRAIANEEKTKALETKKEDDQSN